MRLPVLELANLLMESFYLRAPSGGSDARRGIRCRKQPVVDFAVAADTGDQLLGVCSLVSEGANVAGRLGIRRVRQEFVKFARPQPQARSRKRAAAIEVAHCGFVFN